MKKFINIAIILVFLITICVVEQVLAQKYLHETNEMALSLQGIVETSENVDTENINNLTNEINEYWAKKENILCTFANHKDIEDVGVELNKMKTASKENNREVYIESLELVIFYLKAYQHVVGITMQNLF